MNGSHCGEHWLAWRETYMETRTLRSGIGSTFYGTWAIGGGSWWGDNDAPVKISRLPEQGIQH